jgi:geranylgeranyl diphosphate synthase type II
MMKFRDCWALRLEKVERILAEALPGRHEEPKLLHEAMRYSTLEGGKRLRALLAMAACEAVGGDLKKTGGFAAAVEMVHAYSLIHDDLPCMDDDDMRRGKPTNHRVFGEAVAVLAGDGLLTQAFLELARMPEKYGISAETTVRVVEELAQAIGSLGMVGGQVVDILSEGKEISGETLEYIHSHKTGALFTAALRGGALLGGCSERQLELLTIYGENFGLAFQITDDILDEVGDSSQTGKAVGADREAGKQTYPHLYGLERSRELARECVQACLDALEGFPAQAWFLRELAKFVLIRES